MPSDSIRVATTAQQFLTQVWKELQDWTLIAINAAQTMATAVMNMILLSIVAVFGVLAVAVLFLRDQIMDRRAATVEDRDLSSAHTGKNEQLIY